MNDLWWPEPGLSRQARSDSSLRRPGQQGAAPAPSVRPGRWPRYGQPVPWPRAWDYRQHDRQSPVMTAQSGRRRSRPGASSLRRSRGNAFIPWRSFSSSATPCTGKRTFPPAGS